MILEFQPKVFQVRILFCVVGLEHVEVRSCQYHIWPDYGLRCGGAQAEWPLFINN